jgi:GTP cyclohydrolase IA
MRAFSIEEANELVPTLHRIVSRLMLQKDVITARVEALHTRLGFLPRDFSPLLDDDGDVVDLKREAAESLAAFETGWAEVSDLGGVVKDPKEGLVDFYGRLEEDDDEFVWLCWRFGEERIAFYHGLEEGFAQRKPLPNAPATHPLLSLFSPPRAFLTQDPSMPPVDRVRAAAAIEEFLRALGHEPASEPALRGTGQRVAEAWADDLLAGEEVDLGALLQREAFVSDSSSSDFPFVTLRDLDIVTMCPHHLLPSVGRVTLVFHPHERLVGVGTLSDLVDAVSRRLALQEDIASALVDALVTHLGARGAACRLTLRHGCMSARGTRRHADVEALALRGSLHPRGEFHRLVPTLLGAGGGGDRA